MFDSSEIREVVSKLSLKFFILVSPDTITIISIIFQKLATNITKINYKNIE